MADFSELCPLFATGVYSETTFSTIEAVSGFAATNNLLEGKIVAGTGANGFTFGRTVVVTDAFIQRYATNVEAENLYLQHRTSAGAAATNIGTLQLTNTTTDYNKLTWMRMVVGVSSATFTSSEVLGLGVGTLTAVTQGSFNLMVRYREK